MSSNQDKKFKRIIRKKKFKNQAMEYLSHFNINDMIFRSSFLKSRRKIIIHCGPTNSGKTYDALERLKKAQTGAYLGPLRLLALEVYDKLNDSGIGCNLLTGEERIYDPQNKIVSSTIEMCNLDKVYDVVVIDEAQMITDRHRGGYWTKAILLVKAKELHICTAPESLEIIKDLLNSTGATFKVIEHKRLTPLIFKGGFNNFRYVQQGDAIIAFSRQMVLRIAAYLEQLGIKCSVIYGSLPPTARKEEVKKFVDKETEVIVATDAIGMGVSLPIKRIIFSNLIKFDGKQCRKLNFNEIKQIAGRAGRYGIYSEGHVLTMTDHNYVQEAIKAKSGKIDYISLPFPREAIESDFDIPTLIEQWTALPSVPYLKRENLADVKYLYKHLPENRGELTKSQIFSFINCHFDVTKKSLLHYWQDCVKAIIEYRPIPSPEDLPEDTLEECEKKYHIYDIYFQILRCINVDIDFYDQKNRLSERINFLLRVAKSDYSPNCIICGNQISITNPSIICPNCRKKEY